MKTKNTKASILALILTVSQLFSNAQNSKLQSTKLKVYKRYAIEDTTQTLRHGVIVMYTNNTYVNFGFCKEGYDNEYFLYSTGTWNSMENTFEFKFSNNIFDTKMVQKGIHSYYKKNQKNLLKKSKYEFVKEFYRKKMLVLREAELVDSKKNIVYREEKM